MTINVVPGSLPPDSNALAAGLPLQEEPEVDYCGTLDIVIPQGEPAVGPIANGITVPAACFPQPSPQEEVELRMVKWDDENRLWTYSDINPGTDPLYPAVLWPRMPLRVSDLVRQLNLNYRRPGDEDLHRLNGWLTDSERGSLPLASSITFGDTIFNFGSSAGAVFRPDTYVRIGSEICYVTAVSGAQIQVVRARLGTSESFYNVGVPVRFDAYCDPQHDYAVLQAYIIGGLRDSPYEKTRTTYFPGATPTGSLANWDCIIEDEDGDTESRGFVIQLQENANPTTRDGGEVILHLTPLISQWAW